MYSSTSYLPLSSLLWLLVVLFALFSAPAACDLTIGATASASLNLGVVLHSDSDTQYFDKQKTRVSSGAGRFVDRRRIRVRQNGVDQQSLMVSMDSMTATYKDSLRLEIVAGAVGNPIFGNRTGIDVRIRYFDRDTLKTLETDNPTDGSDVYNIAQHIEQLNFGMKAHSLVEFNATIMPYPVFSGSSYNILQIYTIGQAGFKPIDYTLVGATGSRILTAIAATADNLFTASIRVSESELFSGNVTLHPNGIKVDYFIRNFPWVGASGSGSRIALRCHYRGQSVTIDQTVMDPSDETTKTVVTTSPASVSNSLTWAPFAVDGSGNDFPVISWGLTAIINKSDGASNHDDDGDFDGSVVQAIRWYRQYFIFGTSSTPNYIEWDPDTVLGINNAASAAVASRIAVLAAVLVALASVVLM